MIMKKVLKRFLLALFIVTVAPTILARGYMHFFMSKAEKCVIEKQIIELNESIFSKRFYEPHIAEEITCSLLYGFKK